MLEAAYHLKKSRDLDHEQNVAKSETKQVRAGALKHLH